MAPLRIGVIGCGTMGAAYATGLARGAFGAGATLVGVCDVDAERGGGAGERLDVPAFTDTAELIEGIHPDALYIAVPDPTHRGPFVTAAERGVAVLVEKPLATTVEDAEAMVEAAREGGITAEVNFSNRWNPPFVAAKRRVDAGELGEVIAVNARLNNTISSPTENLPWAGQSSSAWFLLSHVLDLVRWLTGKRAEQVWANGVRRKLVEMGVPTWDHVHAMVRYEDGSDGLFESVWVLPESMPSPVDFKLELVGTEGVVAVDTHHQMLRVATADRFEQPGVLQWAVPRFAAFLARVEAKDTDLGPLEDGLENTRLLVAIHRSLDNGELVDVAGGTP